MMYIYLLYHKDNHSHRLTCAAYSSLEKVMEAYNDIRIYLHGYPVNFMSMKASGSVGINVQYGDELIAHCYVDPKDFSETFDSHYIIKKILN